MCGILFHDLAGLDAATVDAVRRRAAASLAHRGPEGFRDAVVGGRHLPSTAWPS